MEALLKKFAGTVLKEVSVTFGVLVVSTLLLSMFGVRKKTTITYSEYLKDIVSSGTTSLAAKGFVDQLRKDDKTASEVDYDRMERELDNCLQRRIKAWLKSGDKRLHKPIFKADVFGMSLEFISGCAEDLTTDH